MENKNCVKPTDDTIKEIAMDMVREKMEIFERNTVNEIQKKLNCMIEDVWHELKRYNLRTNELKELLKGESSYLSKTNGKVPTNNDSKSRKELPEKIFVPRNSILVDLLEVGHIKSIYHICLTMLIILFMNTIIPEFIENGRFNIGLQTIALGFGRFHYAILIWFLMQAVVLIVYKVFKVWAEVRQNMKRGGTTRKLWDISFLLLFIIYQNLFFLSITSLVKHYQLATITSIATLMEMTRFVMKVHAFVRYNAGRQLKGKEKATETTKDKPIIPSFDQYVYFLFAPTLLYRDNYPRTAQIRWRIVFSHLFEVLGTIFLTAFYHERYLMPTYSEFGKKEIQASTLVLNIFNTMMPAIMIFLSSFFCLLHAWLNATSEMMRFADRLFYKDWWNSITWDAYYRTWNIVVHDWLYEFIYKETYNNIFKGSKSASAIMTFLISAIVHEYIIVMSFDFFYPVLFVFFAGVGVSLTFVSRHLPKSVGNLSLWLALTTGQGMLVSLYYMEYYARQNCPVDNTWADFFQPISWRCNGIISNPNWKMSLPWD